MKSKLNNRGFSLVELIVTIAIFAVLASIITIATLSQLEKAKRVETLTSAENICTAVQTAMIDMAAEEPGAFQATLNYTKDGQAAGSFTSTIMYRYLDMGDPNGLYSTMTGAQKLECYLSAIASNTIAGSESYTIGGSMTTGSLAGKSTTALSNTGQYGQIVFSMAYNAKCEILCFECVYKGYYVKIEGTDYTVEHVADDLRFESWP